MGSLSNYSENALLDHVLKTASFSQPTNLYVALSTANPTDDGSGIAEPAGSGYARVQHNAWAVAAARATSNSGTVQFPEASGSWGTIAYWAVFDASSGGNMISHGAITAGSFAVGSGDAPYFDDGDIDVSFSSGAISTYLANELLDHLFKVGAYTVPTNLYVGLSTANPTDDASGLSEPGSGAYARVLTNVWDAAASGATANTGAITFPEATGSWGTLSHLVLFDASAAGNILIYCAAGSSKAIGSGQTAEIGAGDFDITMD